MVCLLKNSHCVGEANVHLQFTPKYRKPVFEDNVVRFACLQVFKGIASRLGIGLAGVGFGPDHVHLFVTGCKNYSAKQLAKRFKGASSRVLRKNYQDRLNKWLWGDSLWTSGYFYRYVGAVTNEAMQKYVTESQSKHWTTTISNQPQTTLLDYGRPCGL